jgi:tetraacyldisaccharide 4'-kinase
MSILPDADSFKRLVDGTACGPSAAAARGLLAALALPYCAAVAARNRAYDTGLLPSRAARVPVVSVGNLTLGGTGKTPLVAWVAHRLRDQGRRPAVVSRGYAARPGETSDEAAELAILVPGLTHVADRDRVAAAGAAAAAGADVVVLDDGFQHRRLHRDLDIVAVDATDPFGCGHLFPRGLLREPLAGIRRADAIVLTRATSVDAGRRAEVRAALAAAAGRDRQPAWMEAEHLPVGLRTASGTVRPLDDLRGRRVVGFAGIGNPAAFRSTLTTLGADVVAFHRYPDHHAYDADDLRQLAGQAAGARAELVATTLKDLVKLGRDDLDGIPLVAVEIAIEPLTGADAVVALLANLQPNRSSRRIAS